MLSRLLLSASALLMWGCTDNPPAAKTATSASDAPMTMAEATSGPSNVSMWVTGDEDTTVYLFGTVHILTPDIEWKNARFQKAWDDSTVVFLEADVTSPEAMNEAAALIPQYGVNPPGTTLSSFFTEDEIAQINTGLSGLNITINMLDPLRPWLAGLQVSNLALQSIGGKPEAGIEMILTADADASGKEMRYLETLREQIEILSGGEDAAQARLFLDGIDDLADPEAFFARLVGAWYQGDDQQLGDILLEALDGAPEIADALLYRRNENWADQLNTLMADEPGVFFVAVGAAHLAGEKSVQDYLAMRGHTTEQVE